MARKRSISTQLRLLAALLLLAMAGAAWLWWQFLHWQPERATFPVQGAYVGTWDGGQDFRSLKAVGADFVYLEASRGADGRDPAFSRNLAAARTAGLQVGAVHVYDPCLPADGQAANFVTVVPRDAALLPPAVELDKLAENCSHLVGEAAVESELTTFLNQIEGHTGKPALLKVSPAFEARYHIASRIERNLWLTRDRFQPDYAGRPWTLWTANSALRSDGSANPLRWVVVQP